MTGRPEPSQWQELGTAWNAVIELTAAIAVYGLLGWWLDSRLGTGHVLFVLGLVGGNALGMYVLVKRAQHATAAEDAARSTDRSRATG